MVVMPAKFIVVIDINSPSAIYMSNELHKIGSLIFLLLLVLVSILSCMGRQLQLGHHPSTLCLVVSIILTLRQLEWSPFHFTLEIGSLNINKSLRCKDFIWSFPRINKRLKTIELGEFSKKGKNQKTW